MVFHGRKSEEDTATDITIRDKSQVKKSSEKRIH